MSSFTDVPSDVLCSYILKHLSLMDLSNFKLVNKQSYTIYQNPKTWKTLIKILLKTDENLFGFNTRNLYATLLKTQSGPLKNIWEHGVILQDLIKRLSEFYSFRTYIDDIDLIHYTTVDNIAKMDINVEYWHDIDVEFNISNEYYIYYLRYSSDFLIENKLDRVIKSIKNVLEIFVESDVESRNDSERKSIFLSNLRRETQTIIELLIPKCTEDFVVDDQEIYFGVHGYVDIREIIPWNIDNLI